MVLQIEVTLPEDLHCAGTRQVAEEVEAQAKQRGWRVVGKRTRTLVTRFGDLRVERKLYRDEEGNPHSPLDEALGWQPRQVATPGIQEAVVALATDLSFE